MLGFGKNKLIAVVACAVLGLGAVTSCVGCFGQRARDHVLTPAIGQAALGTHGIRADFIAGLGTVPEDQRVSSDDSAREFFAAVESGDRFRLLAEDWRWPDIRAVAEAGIAARLASGSIGPAGADAKLERLRQFDTALRALADPGPVAPAPRS